MPPRWQVWGLALWLAGPANFAMWMRVWEVTPDVLHRVALLAGLGTVVMGLNAALLSLLSWPKVYRTMASLLVLIAAGNAYYMWQYGVVIDSTMMANILNTDAREVRDLLSIGLLWVSLSLCVPALWWIWRKPLGFGSVWSQLGRNLVGVLVGLAVALAALMASYQGLASLMRNHKSLRFMVNPLNTVYAGVDLTIRQLPKTVQPLKVVGADAALGKAYQDGGPPPLLMLVIGETARAQNFSINGYARKTSPQLERWQANEGLVNFPQVSACGTNTQVSLPCIFSPLTREEGGDARPREENLLDVLQRSGLAVLWLDNQSGCKGICDRVDNATTRGLDSPKWCESGECFDEVMLEGLDERLSALDPVRRAKGVVLVMHQMGSHGPAYFRRTPPDRKPFQPECDSQTLSSCTPESLVNVYDNTIAYTDHFLGRTLAWLKARDAAGTNRTGMLYVSDHGESLGESGLYLHGVPYALAPKEQTDVPMVMWMSPAMAKWSGVDPACLARQGREGRFSHDNVFHTVLGWMDVQTSARSEGLDLMAVCRKGG